VDNASIKVLYVDDEVNNLASFKACFRREFEVHTALSGAEGLEILNKEEIHVIVTDQRMPGMTGIEFLVEVLKKHSEPIRILLTGYADIEAVIDAINKGQVYKYMTKPWEPDNLRNTITKAYEVYRLRKENKELTLKLMKANEQLEFMLRQKLIS
jgi:DNA-binding NtrC family response regulator